MTVDRTVRVPSDLELPLSRVAPLIPHRVVISRAGGNHFSDEVVVGIGVSGIAASTSLIVALSIQGAGRMNHLIAGHRAQELAELRARPSGPA
jgi:hypothetical protein